MLSIVSCSNEASSTKVSVHLAHAKLLAPDVRLVLGVPLNVAHPRTVAGHNVIVRVVLVPVRASAVPPSLDKETRVDIGSKHKSLIHYHYCTGS